MLLGSVMALNISNTATVAETLKQVLCPEIWQGPMLAMIYDSHNESGSVPGFVRDLRAPGLYWTST